MMLKHKLKVLVLRQLSKGSNTGYQLIKEIYKETGWRPSYGSLYPLLNQLKNEGILSCAENGRKKSYSLTKVGKETLHEMNLHQDEMLTKIRDNFRLISHLMGLDKDLKTQTIANSFFEAIKEGKIPLHEPELHKILKQSGEMKSEFWRLYKEDLLKSHKREVLEILKDTTKRLKKIKKNKKN